MRKSRPSDAKGDQAAVGVAIVDDDAGFSAALAALLELDAGFRLIGTAASVEDGLALLADPRVQVGLIDVQMPRGGGLRVVDEVRRWSRFPALLLISASPPTSAVIESGHGFISKHDIDPETLGPLVQRLSTK